MKRLKTNLHREARVGWSVILKAHPKNHMFTAATIKQALDALHNAKCQLDRLTFGTSPMVSVEFVQRRGKPARLEALFIGPVDVANRLARDDPNFHAITA